MGDLAEWIRINRRADATPAPAETLAPAPAPTAAPLPQAGGVQTPLGTLLPTVSQLRDVGIPLLLYAVFGSAFVLLLIAALRQFRAARRKE